MCRHLFTKIETIIQRFSVQSHSSVGRIRTARIHIIYVIWIHHSCLCELGDRDAHKQKHAKYVDCIHEGQGVEIPQLSQWKDPSGNARKEDHIALLVSKLQVVCEEPIDVGRGRLYLRGQGQQNRRVDQKEGQVHGKGGASEIENKISQRYGARKDVSAPPEHVSSI